MKIYKQLLLLSLLVKNLPPSTHNHHETRDLTVTPRTRMGGRSAKVQAPSNTSCGQSDFRPSSFSPDLSLHRRRHALLTRACGPHSMHGLHINIYIFFFYPQPFFLLFVFPRKSRKRSSCVLRSTSWVHKLSKCFYQIMELRAVLMTCTHRCKNSIYVNMNVCTCVYYVCR